MLSDEEKEKLARVESIGRQAGYALKQIEPFLDNMEETKFSTLLLKYKDGKTPAELLPEIASLSVLNDLRNDIEYKVREGHRARKALGIEL